MAFFSATKRLVSVLLVLVSVAGAQVVNRIQGEINDAVRVELGGNVHPLAEARAESGVVAGETELKQMQLVLQGSAAQESALDALLRAQQNPRSAQYHKWLKPSEFAARFGVSASDLAQVTGWLREHGFTVDEVAASHRLVSFSGTASQVEAAFGTELRHYTVNGERHLANAGNPQIPEALSGVVGGVVSLHDFRRAPSLVKTKALGTKPQWTSGSSHYLMPLDYGTIYDINALYSAGTKGTGVTIAVAGRSNITLSDVASFRSTAGLAANVPTVVLVNTNPGLVSGDQDESTLDVEWAGAVGQSASVQFVTAASTSTSDGIDLAVAYIVNHKIGQVVSLSYGSCEQYMGSTELAFYNNLWKQAASQGMSVFVSSGDSGAAGCDSASATSGTQKGVNGLCSSPYATCVGGTEFNDTASSSSYWSSTNGAGYSSALGYIPEMVWNESSSNSGSGLWASGGGVSQAYAQPSWQQGVVSASDAGGMRTVPDVSLTAASHDGYIIVENGSYWVAAGTSAAAPSMAGIMALVVQSQNGVGQGNANSVLYALSQGKSSPFHATPTGSNGVTGVAGYKASGATYNLATGLGSVDAGLLLSAWGSSSNTAATPTLSVAAGSNSISFNQGTSTTLTVTLTGTGSFSSPVTLALSGMPYGVTTSWSSNPVTVGAGTVSVTLTMKAGRLSEQGINTVTLTATGGGLTATTNFQVEVLHTPTGTNLPAKPVTPTRVIKGAKVG